MNKPSFSSNKPSFSSNKPSFSSNKPSFSSNKQFKVVVDADAIIAQTNPNDIHHQTAAIISESLARINAQVIYPVTAIAESNAYIQRVLNSTATAYGTAIVFTDPNVQVVEVNQSTLKNALRFFSPTTSKKNTLFDCTVAAIAEEYKADAIFSFDKFYKSRGFKLAVELPELNAV